MYSLMYRRSYFAAMKIKASLTVFITVFLGRLDDLN